MRKVKIEYDPSYKIERYRVSIKDHFWSSWGWRGTFETLDEAQKEAAELLKYPICLNNARSGEL